MASSSITVAFPSPLVRGTDIRNPGRLDVTACSIGDRSLSPGRSGARTAEVHIVVVTLPHSSAVPDLWRHAVDGTEFPKVVIEWRSVGAVVMRLTLLDVMIASFDFLGPSGASMRLDFQAATNEVFSALPGPRPSSRTPAPPARPRRR